MQKELELFSNGITLEMENSFVPEFLLILDTETTGIDPSVDHCIEIDKIMISEEVRKTTEKIMETIFDSEFSLDDFQLNSHECELFNEKVK